MLVIDALDAKRYDSPFVFGFILLSRRPWGRRNPFHSDSTGSHSSGLVVGIAAESQPS
eukprot:COSAG01_NODE_49455_length_372_cov_0.619048_1_plen_57_part_01